MSESKDLKMGETTQYDIGGKTLKLKPVPLGRMKKAMAAFTNKDANAFDMMLDYLAVMFGGGENPEVTREWLEDNVTLVDANRIINDMRVINGLEKGNFLAGAAGNGAATRDLIEATPTPSV